MKGKMDAVVISTPDHNHFAVAMSAVKHGYSIYLEKPLCYSIWQCRELAKAAKAAGVKTQMGNFGPLRRRHTHRQGVDRRGAHRNGKGGRSMDVPPARRRQPAPGRVHELAETRSDSAEFRLGQVAEHRHPHRFVHQEGCTTQLAQVLEIRGRARSATSAAICSTFRLRLSA